MKKLTKLKICDWSLLVFTLLILASGVQLEAIGSRGVAWVWIHIGVGATFMALCAFHIYLHYGKSNWFARFHKQKNQVTRLLWWLGIATLLSAVIATAHWLTDYSHGPIGGVHGKIGFVMLAVALGHIIKRFKFFRGIRSKTSVR